MEEGLEYGVEKSSRSRWSGGENSNGEKRKTRSSTINLTRKAWTEPSISKKEESGGWAGSRKGRRKRSTTPN